MTTALFLLLALAAAAFGFFTTSQATLGAASIAMACFLGILARLDQAARHQRQLGEWLGKLSNDPATVVVQASPRLREIAVVTTLTIIGIGVGGWVWYQFL